MFCPSIIRVPFTFGYRRAMTPSVEPTAAPIRQALGILML
jgi:hypothetical protein